MYIADLHIHSKYSRATSKDLEPEQLAAWAARKGIGLVGTGDFTHPAWRAELQDKLVEEEEGVYTLKGAGADAPRFVVSGEISTIYKKNDKVRKVHSLILLPNLEGAENLSRRLEAIGNIRSDGRPILGLDCRDLLEITLEACPDAVFVPAHIWTPHFSLFGAFSGFDTLEECFEDLSGEIHALETGLSADPPMLWRCSALDKYTLISNSDAHSPSKLGREANLLDTGRSYPELARAIRTGAGFAGTIEFFPEEGKYHFDGHRNCGVCLSPVEAEAVDGKCPVCGRRLTPGVLHRVEQLADRPEGFRPQGAKPFESLAPLPEVIAASAGGAAAGRQVEARCELMLRELGPEFYILRQAPLEDVRHVAGPCVAEGIRRLRAGEVARTPGYDGAYGAVELLSPAEREAYVGQVSLFGVEKPARKKTTPAGKVRAVAPSGAGDKAQAASGPNEAQRAATEAVEPDLAVIAGPGTGKTYTLVSRIAHLLEQGAKPGQITAVTFTNRAAGELRERLGARLGRRTARGIHIGTFHTICLELLGAGDGGRLADPWEQRDLAAAALKELGRKGSPGRLLREISAWKNGGGEEDAAFACYERLRREAGWLDFDDLLLETLEHWESGEAGTKKRARFTHLLVDEFQDCSPIQYRLVQAWRQGGESLFVIGDPDQAIYGFRGADSSCFARLRADLSGLREIALTENYRSSPEILACALPVIGENGGAPRRLEARRPSGAAVRLVRGGDERAEAIFIAKEIGRLVGGVGMLEAQETGAGRGARSFGEIAVLCRTRRQLERLEFCLGHDGIPCVVAGRGDFLADGTVREAVNYFRSHPERTGAPKDLLEEWCAHRVPSPALERLINMAVFFSDMPDFLENLTLGREADLLRRAGAGYDAGAVTLSTLHAAKGLEWPVVFLAGAAKGLVPLERMGVETDPAEERRLLYVGMTRARDELILTCSGAPSPFLSAIPEGWLAQSETGSVPASARAEQLSLF